MNSKRNNAKSLSRTGAKLFQVLFVLVFTFSLVGVQPAKPVQAATTVNLPSAGETYLRQGFPTYNYGGTVTVSVSNGTNKQNSLYKWDLSTIPAGSTITSASITFRVTDASTADFSIFAMRRAWVEGNSNDAASTTSANFNTSDGSTTWGTAGAMNTSSDRYNTDLWDATGGSGGTFSATGDVTIPLNASGVSAVQGWVTNSSTNFGLTMQFTGTTGTADYWIVASKENTSTYTSPTLNVTYEAAGPTIITSVSSLPAFATPPGTPSAVQTYTVSGVNLTNNIDISAPGGFEISADGGTTYSSSVSLTQTDGLVSSTTIYVRLTGAAEGEFGGNIAHVSSGAGTKNVAVTGKVSNEICVTSRISAGSDDVEQRINTGTTNGAVDLDGDTTNKWLQMYRAYGGSTTDLNWWGLRFLSVNVPVGATITSADVTFRANATSGTADSGMTLWGQLAADPPTFTATSNNVSDRAKTTSSASWVVPQWTTGLDYATPDLAAVVQEIVSQAGWAANNAMVIIGQTTVSQNRTALSNNSTNGATLAPLLEVCYTQSTDPMISTSGTLAAFATLPNVASDSQSYSVSAMNLTDDLLITAPIGFQLSLTSGGTYGSTLNLTPEDGAIPSTPIYVRLLSATVNSFGGDITHTSGTATQKNVAVEGTVSNQICEDISLEATGDNYLSVANVQYNNGGSTSVRVDNTTGTSRRTGLFKWDVSAIPTTAQIQTASLKLNVTETSALVFNLYNMRQDWVEGNSDRTNSTTSSNWNTYDGVNNWGTAGAASIESDRYDENLWGAGTTSFSSNGSKTLALNTAGVGVVQGWVDLSLPNYGLAMQNFSGTSADAVQFDSSEATTAENRPTLLVNYCVGNVVTYTLTVGTDGHGTVNLSPSGNTYAENQVVTLSPVPNSGYQFSQWTGTNATNIVNTSGVYTIVMNGDKSIDANFSRPPSAPTLDLPADDATGIGLSPLLRVNVSDPDNDTMSVSFYGRPVSTVTPAEDFMIIAVPDTQNLAQYNPTVMSEQFEWIKNRYTTPGTGNPSLVYVTNLGDIVNTASDATQWQNADNAYDKLDAAGVPYSVGPGNHDLGTLYSTNFGNARFSGKSWYQGYYTSGTDNYNSYSFFSASGMDFIVINLQYSPGSEALDWADALLKTHSNRRAIVAQHDILNINDSWVNQASYTALSDNPNLFLMLCGHMHSSSDGSAYRLEPRTGMNPVHIVQTDYQDMISGVYTDYLRLLSFKPSADQIYAQVFSPNVPGGNLTSATNYEQFNMTYDMVETTAAPFELIGTVNGIASGTQASITWAGRTASTEYEWYAVANDGSLSTDSSVWSFTTGTGAVNQAPVVSDIPDQTISEGATFATISLDDYVTDPDDSDAEMVWSSTGASQLNVSIVNRVATISIPSTEWSGSETITFRATDPGSLYDDDSATFTVTAVNDPPVVSGIPDQTISEGASFATISLDDYVTDPDNTDAQMAWSFSGNTSLTVSIVNRVATITIPSTEWSGNETITFRATDPGSLYDDDSATFTVTAVNDPPVVSGIPDQTISEGASFATITLDNYVVDPDNTDAEMNWSFSGNTSLTVSIVNRVATIGVPNLDWNGNETITFRATDPGSSYDEDSASFTITAVNDAPVITGQAQVLSVPQDTSLTIELAHLSVTDVDNTYPTGFSLTVLPGTNYTVVGATITPTAGFYGVLTVPVKVNDGQEDSNTYDLTVTVTQGGVTPVLPSSFWGLLHFAEGDSLKLDVGDTLYAYLNSETTAITSVIIGSDGTDLTYAINVPAYPNGTHPTTVKFTAVGRVLGIANWSTGTNVEFNMHPPLPDAGGPYVSLVSAGSVVLSGSVSDLGNDVNTTNWDLDNDGSFDDSAVLTPTFNFTSAGTYPVSLKAVDLQGGEGIDSSQVFAITLSGLTDQVYNGNPHPVTVTGVSSPFSYNVLYNGSATAPTNAGTYPVVIEFLSGTEVIATYNTSLVIGKATATVTLGSLSQTYDAATKAASATTTPAGLTVNFVYDPANPVNAGSYAVTATVSDTNYSGTASGTLVIGKATATVTLGSLSQTYNGTAKAATATTAPTGLTVNFVYDPANPVNAGSYAVTATIVDSNYQGTASGTLVIGKATATVTLGSLSQTYDGTAKVATATTAPTGLTVNFVYDPANPVNAGSYAVTATVSDTNYSGTASGTLVIGKATATVTLGSLSQTYDGTAKAATATTNPTGLTVNFVYDPVNPVNAGNYAVTATVSDTNYSGTASGTLVIGKATASVSLSNLQQQFDGSPKSVTVTTDPSGLTVVVTYDGSTTPPSAAGSYAVVATVNDANYSGSASGTLEIGGLSYSIDLVAGWNLVSFNLTPTSTDPVDIFASITGKYDLVYAWDASVSTNNWLRHDPTSLYGDTLTALHESMGFWIYMNEPATLTLTGTVPTSTTIQLYSGWNLIGYPSQTAASLPAALEELAGNYDLIVAYHAADLADPWKLFDPDAPAFANDLESLQPGWGYWLKVVVDDTLTINY